MRWEEVKRAQGKLNGHAISKGARLLRVSDATLALSAFAARRALPRFRLHFFGLLVPSACITKPTIRSSAGSREQLLTFASRLRRRVQGGTNRADRTLDARQRLLGELSEL